MTLIESARSGPTASWLAERIPGRSALEIGAGIEALIRDGDLGEGAQLPTIRELARALDLSVGTILIAWGRLRELGLIETHRRGGTVVRSVSKRPSAFRGWHELDFTGVAPDISLQPDLSRAVLDSLGVSDLNAWGRDYMTERLLGAVEKEWPFEAEAWATAGGGTEALLLATAAAAPPGSVIAVDEPVSPGLLDTLRDLELTAVGVAADEEGPTVESLRAALAKRPKAFVFQPGAAFAARPPASARRIRELADVIRAHDEKITIVEDDAIGPLAEQTPLTLGTELPGQVIRVRSYCKAYGIDVRTSVIGGSRELVERSIQLRSHGVGSNSRILQNTLAYLIRSEAANSDVALARETYAARKQLLVAALGARGITVHTGPDSIVLWIEVADETETILRLASRGIAVGSGSRSFVAPLNQQLIRVSPMQLPDSPELVEQFAEILADATSRAGREFFE